MLFCPSSIQDTKTLIIINSTTIYSIQMLADDKIEQFWMPSAVTDVSKAMLLNPKLKELGDAPYISAFTATLTFIN